MDELPAEAADHVLGLVAVHRAARGRDVLDALIGRQAPDDVGRVLGEQAKQLLALAQRLAQLALGGDVLADGRDPCDLVVLEQDGLGARPDPARLAVGAHDAVLEVRRGSHRVAPRDHGGAIVRMQQPLDQERVVVDVGELDAEDPRDRRARVQHARRVDVAQQEALLEGLRDLAEALLALAQLLLELTSLRDVVDVADQAGLAVEHDARDRREHRPRLAAARPDLLLDVAHEPVAVEQLEHRAAPLGPQPEADLDHRPADELPVLPAEHLEARRVGEHDHAVGGAGDRGRDRRRVEDGEHVRGAPRGRVAGSIRLGRAGGLGSARRVVVVEAIRANPTWLRIRVVDFAPRVREGRGGEPPVHGP